jgi:predicted outer membrane repeat protein
MNNKRMTISILVLAAVTALLFGGSRGAAAGLLPPPVANDDSYTTNENTPLVQPALGVLANDDSDGQALDAQLVSGPANGTLALRIDGSFAYTPDLGFSGDDTFTYQALEHEGLVGYWRLDDDSSSALAAAGNDGFLVNMEPGDWVPGAPGITFDNPFALDFDGVNEWVLMPHDPVIHSLTNTLTVAAWINPDTLSGIQRVVSMARTGDNNGFGFGTYDAGLRFTTFGVHDYNTTSVNLTPGWVHVAAVMDSGHDVTYYVNGTAVETITHTVPANADGMDNLLIGASTAEGSSSPVELFDGRIDDVRIYNRALTGPEVANLAAGDSGSGAASNTATVTVTVRPNICFATHDDGATIFSSTDAQALRDAVAAAGPGDTVKIAGTCTGTQGGQVVLINKNLTLRGGYDGLDWTTPDPDAYPTTLDAAQSGRVIERSSATIVTLENLRITGGQTGSNGAAIAGNFGALTIRNSHVFSNTTTNFANGSALRHDFGELTIEDSTFNGNTSGGVGTLYVNYADAVQIVNTVFNDNEVYDDGGAVYLYQTASTIIQDSLFEANTSMDGIGGAIYAYITPLTIANSAFVGNDADRDAGAIYVYDADALTINNSFFQGNNTPGDGAIYIEYVTQATISDSLFQDNSAREGGAIYGFTGDAGDQLRIGGSTFTGNTSTDEGGALRIFNINVTIENSTFSNNTAGTNGGVLYAQGGSNDIILRNSTFFSNTAASGGNVYRNFSNVFLDNTIIAGSGGDNCAGTGAGAFNSAGHNLADDATCNLTAAGDVTNTDPLLGPLGNNGGPTTPAGTVPTYDLLGNSPALDAGNCSGGLIAVDQRDLARPRGPACDIGAIERGFVDAVDDSYTTPQDTPLIVLDPGALAGGATPDAAWLADHFGVRPPRPLQNSQLLLDEMGLLANDVTDEGSLDAGLLTGPANGAVGLNGDGTFIYVPDPGFTGPDTFTYRAVNGMFNDTAVVTINVTPVNQAPVALNDVYVTAEDTPLTVPPPGVLSNDSDGNGDPLTASLDTPPAVGTLQLNADGSFDYTPALNFNDVVTFTYTASDGTLTDTAIVYLLITAVNDPPVPNAGPNQTATAGTPVNFNGSFDDPDPADVHIITWDFGDGNTADGTLMPSHTYTGPGLYTVTLTVDDNNGGVASDTLLVTVEAGEPGGYFVYLPVALRN